MPETIETRQQFEDTPVGWASRWTVEFQAARKELESWLPLGEEAIDAYVGKGKNPKLNLFHGDVETRKALLYGNPPQVRSRRRYADPDDDVARVSAEMQARMLNCDIERDTDGFRTALAYARDDRLLPGLGVVRLRYVAEWEDVPETPAQVDPVTGVELAPAVPATQRKAHEDVETDSVHWRDFLWGPARTWDEVPWLAFRAEMTREKLHERFDDTIANGDADLGPRLVEAIPLAAKERTDEKIEDPWARAAVWEVWHKESREVFWFVEGFDRILDRKDDPLGLDGFWPSPKPLFANVTSRRLVPVPDYAIAKALYLEIENLSERICDLEDAIRVTGAFDSASPEIPKMLSERGNKLYPMQNMAAYIEKGGSAKAVDWFPIEPVVKAIDVLTLKRQEKIGLLYQVTGMSDIMRGQGVERATATEQRIKARFGSTRVQASQDEFARFTTDAQRIRAEIIAKHFDAETIVERSNILRTKDAQLAQPAAELLKSEWAQYRIEVATDTLAMTDYDAVKAERVEVIGALGGLLQASMPLVQVGGPQAMEFVLEAAGWLMAGTKGGSTLEGVFDRFKSQVQQAAAQPKPPPPPDPRLLKAQVDLKTAQVKGQVAVIGAQADIAKTKVEMQKTAQDAALDRQNFGLRMAEMQAKREMAADMPGVESPQGAPA